MIRKLASVVEIATCDPIPETERLSVATMVGKGWKVVTMRDEYKPGDKAVYFEIDAALDPEDERYAFLKDRCLRKFVSKGGKLLRSVIRIKTVKLRGVISQGLLMPIASFPEITSQPICVGADVTETLHVEHCDEIKAALTPMTSISIACGAKMGDFPTSLIPKTDEERIQNLADYFEKMRPRMFEVTEKNDGSSVTMFLSKRVDDEEPFGVCSRNIRLRSEDNKGERPIPLRMADKYDMETKLERANAMLETELAFQGELVGPGINGNRDLYPDFEWHVFKIWDIGNEHYLLPDQARTLCYILDIPYVPVISHGMLVFEQFRTMDALLEYAEGKTGRGNEREGLVFKSIDDPYVSFKAVSNRYLLKQKD